MEIDATTGVVLSTRVFKGRWLGRVDRFCATATDDAIHLYDLEAEGEHTKIPTEQPIASMEGAPYGLAALLTARVKPRQRGGE